MIRLRSLLTLVVVQVLAFASLATAASTPTPKNCGLTYTKYYVIHTNKSTTCAFGRNTYQAIRDYNSAHPFSSGADQNFQLEVPDRNQMIQMDCRARTRAHGEFDFRCNDLNYVSLNRGKYGETHIVYLENATEP